MRTRIEYFLILILLLIQFCGPDGNGGTEPEDENPREPLTLMEKLEALPGVTINEISPNYGYARQFEIDILQPLDHDNPEGTQFRQRLYLFHADTTAPVVFLPSGYTVSERGISYLGYYIGANHLSVTHRFMEGAKPAQMDWQYLNIEQAAADHHRIVTLFREIYTGPWVSYGASKNGMTAIFHKRFYPEDIDAVVAAVAPIMFSAEDERFDHFLLEEVGSPECRAKIKSFQRAVLRNKTTLLPLLDSELVETGQVYSLETEFVLEFALLEYFFYFWQYGDGDCTAIPDSTTAPAELLAHLAEHVWFTDYSDGSIERANPVYYQLYTELGYYRLYTEFLGDLLTTRDSYSHRLLAPQGVDLSFRPDVMQDIKHWIQTEGDHIIYYYGTQDPYTSCAVELTGQSEAYKFVKAGGNHGTRYWELDEIDLFYDLLEEWTGVSFEPQIAKAVQADRLEEWQARPR